LLEGIRLKYNTILYCTILFKLVTVNMRVEIYIHVCTESHPTPASIESDRDHARELADDLLAITTVFVPRHNGQRSAENRRRRKGKTTSAEEAQRNRTTDRPGTNKNRDLLFGVGCWGYTPGLPDH
jgi:hypothetical protein